MHGRSGGVIPGELQTLAAELEQRRAAAVRLLALTDPSPAILPPAAPLAAPATLVPLLLLPGGHVRRDLPALAAELAAQGPLRRLPFLGAWPLWQAALATELAALLPQGTAAPPAVPSAVSSAAAPQPEPLLLHHPLEGPLAERFLAQLGRRCGAICRPAAFPASGSLPLVPPLPPGTPFLPLALAANRLTDSLQVAHPDGAALPLLARPRLRRILLEALLALP